MKCCRSACTCVAPGDITAWAMQALAAAHCELTLLLGPTMSLIPFSRCHDAVASQLLPGNKSTNLSTWFTESFLAGFHCTIFQNHIDSPFLPTNGNGREGLTGWTWLGPRQKVGGEPAARGWLHGEGYTAACIVFCAMLCMVGWRLVGCSAAPSPCCSRFDLGE